MSFLQFDHVATDRINDLSFTVEAGEIRILEVLSMEDKLAVVDLLTGESLPDKGMIRLQGKALLDSLTGSTGWVPPKGALISNLKVWENITLPRWFHGERKKMETEQEVMSWLAELQVDEQDWERFMASPVARLTALERKVAGLLRGLVAAPAVLLLDADLFIEIDTSRKEAWMRTLEKFVQRTPQSAVLILSNSDVQLPWKVIE